MRRFFTLAIAATALLGPAHPAAAQKLAIKAGRVIPVVGAPIENGVILISDGKITDVGPQLTIPIDAQVIEAAGKTVVPGFVDVHNSSGMSQANERNPNVPFLSVIDSIDPSREYFEECRRQGVTTVAVVPGNSTMIGGQAAVVKTAGAYVDDMILRRQCGIKISLRPASGTSRMSHLARLRKEMEKARRADEADSAEEKSNGGEDKADKSGESEKDDNGSTPGSTPAAASTAEQLAAMKKMLGGELPAFVYCENAMDVVQALRLTEQYGLKTILVLGRECYRAADQIADSGLPVILDDTLVFWKTDPRSGEDEKIVLPRIYREKNVPLTFQVGSAGTTLGSSYLWYQAATAVKYGASVDEALTAITLRPAQLLDIAQFVGSIEPGKDADLVILSGDPLKLNTWVEKTIIAGKVVYDRDQDTKLRELLEPGDE